MTRGDIALVHMYGGATGLRRVVEDKGKTIVICAESEWISAHAERRQPTGVGFPRQDVEPAALSNPSDLAEQNPPKTQDCPK